MSAWPEAVWLKNQIASQINTYVNYQQLVADIQELEKKYPSLKNQIDIFTNEEFFTTIIPQDKFQNFPVYHYNDLTTSQNINLKDEIKINGATVFLSDNTNSDIDNSIASKYASIDETIIPIQNLKNTFWKLKDTCESFSVRLRSEGELNLYFTDGNQDTDGTQDHHYKTIIFQGNSIVGITLDNTRKQLYSSTTSWSEDFDNQNIQITSGDDCTNNILIVDFFLKNVSTEEEE